jgi:hypothetical protein
MITMFFGLKASVSSSLPRFAVPSMVVILDKPFGTDGA